MNQPKKTKKRIVSTGEFTAIQTSRTALQVSTALSLVEIAICLYLALYLLFAGFGLFGLLLSLFCVIMAFRFGKMGLAKRRVLAQMEQVVPLSRVDVNAMPTNETLVRASAESDQAQQSVLLRAAVPDEEIPADQLLRAASEKQTDMARQTVPENLVRVDEEPAQELQKAFTRSNVQKSETEPEIQNLHQG